jgi:hypothetical protein
MEYGDIFGSNFTPHPRVPNDLGKMIWFLLH